MVHNLRLMSIQSSYVNENIYTIHVGGQVGYTYAMSDKREFTWEPSDMQALSDCTC